MKEFKESIQLNLYWRGFQYIIISIIIVTISIVAAAIIILRKLFCWCYISFYQTRLNNITIHSIFRFLWNIYSLCIAIILERSKELISWASFRKSILINFVDFWNRSWFSSQWRLLMRFSIAVWGKLWRSCISLMRWKS